MNHPFVSILLVLLIESSIFGLIVLFLVAEETYSILGTLMGILLLGYLSHALPSVRKVIQGLLARHSRVAMVWAFVFLIFLPVLLRNNPYVIHIVFSAGLYAILALGLNFQLGSTNVVNFATAASYGIGAYTSALLSVHLGWSFWILLPISGIVAAFFGFLLGLPTMKTKTYYLSLVTLAFGLIVYLFLNNLSWTGGADGIGGIPFPTIGGFSLGSSLSLFGLTIPFQANFYYLTVLLVILAYVVAGRIHNSKLGLAWNAIRNDEIAAECQGIDVTRSKIIAFCVDAFFGGVAGTIYAFNVSFISPENFTFMVSLTVVTMVIVGGLDNVPGAIFGALLMTLIPEKFQAFQNYRLLLFGLIILVMLFLRPKGIFPQKIRSYE
jgi:ABC-type branched-subunit amino acid transport system permease subunit